MSERESADGIRPPDAEFRLLVESVQDYAILLLDPKGRVASWNPGVERIKGYTEEEILGKDFSIFYTEEDRRRHYPEYELRVAVREGRFEDEGWRIRKDGSRFWANVVITALFDEEDQLVGFGKVTRDLTERVRAESERWALEQERIARQKAEELAEEVRTQAAHLEEQAAELEFHTEELQNQAAQLEEAQGELEVANDELQRANVAFVARSHEAERARAEAEAASRAKSDFLANMSHELRTPINAILGYTNLLEMGIAGPVTEAQAGQLGRIRASSQHLVMLIEDILDLSKIEAGRIEVTRDRARIGDTVDEALSLVAPQAGERDLAVSARREGGRDQPYVGDEDRVRQILVNLLSNAIKFTDPGGRVTVTCDTADGPAPGSHLRGAGPWVRVRVEDTGIGIPPEHRETIFDPFVQVESGRTRTRGGTGLGLSISRQLARIMDGDLTLASEVGKGSCFTLWLPVADPGHHRVELPPAKLIPTSGDRSELSRAGEALQAKAAEVVGHINRRLRSDPIVRTASCTAAELDDHQPAFLAAVGQGLVVLGRQPEGAELVSESYDIQGLLAERHGAQRARLGWSEDALRRELQIVREEVSAAVREALPAQVGDAAIVHQVPARVLNRAEEAAIRGWSAGA